MLIIINYEEFKYWKASLVSSSVGVDHELYMQFSCQIMTVIVFIP